MEQGPLWQSWSTGVPDFAELEVLICPSDPPDVEGEPSLSYVANTGYINNEDDRDIRDADRGLKERIANGQVRVLKESISPLVYAQLMTSNRHQSQLFINENGEQVSDRDLEQPSDDKY